ncbi:hypothetical protein OAG10_07365 [Verrucomicrobia bacterium]|nr:hypothetical protein [Verrucomicrobiota bacterium]
MSNVGNQARAQPHKILSLVRVTALTHGAQGVVIRILRRREWNPAPYAIEIDSLVGW